MSQLLEEPCNKMSVKPATSALGHLLLSLSSQERLFLAVDLVLASVEVGFVGLDHLGLHKELVAKNTDQVDGNALLLC